MSDSISRQAAIDTLMEILDRPNHAEFLYTDEICGVLRNLPPVQPRKGKWIRTRTMTHDGELYCDQCEQEHPEQKIIWNFCPNCGCRMEEGDSDEKD